MDRHTVDPRFHRRILGDALADFKEGCPPVLTYVENHNADPGYDLLAFDYKMAADLLLEEYKRTELGNWSAPTTFVVRQTLELGLKGLLEGTGRLGNAVSPKLVFSHNLEKLWSTSRDWLIANEYPIRNDARFEHTEWIVTNFHAVDPSGDLFRFAHSKFTAFDRMKTYDRAGVYLEFLVPCFNDAHEFIAHWTTALIMKLEKQYQESQGEPTWESPFFDQEAYPRKYVK